MQDSLRNINDSTNDNLYLVGPMGVGKTTVGRALAKKLGKTFVDSDHEIETRTGVSVSVVFDIEGEEGFRQREADVIRDLTQRSNIVLATGGGVVLRQDNRACLKTHGRVIYLRASVDQLLERTRYDKRRPLLQTPDPRQQLENLMRLREPLYEEVADLIIDTGLPSVGLLVNHILKQLESLDLDQTDETDQSAPTTPSAMPTHPAPTILHLDLGKRSYPIIIGPSLLPNASAYLPQPTPQKTVIVTNTIVAPLYLDIVKTSLQAAGHTVIDIILPEGEKEKNWATVLTIFDRLIEEQCDRKTTLIALGGGVIGDLTGFAAATYMRGVPFVQIPTTLLAKVDSSVGGKTGVNHPLGKNMLGAFYQPRAVIADTSTLNTLPERELTAGLAEVIKYGVVVDAVFFEWIESHINALKKRDQEALTYAILRCCELKADVVRQDECDTGVRAVLNFGHTFGHAIELGCGFGQWLHGEAVGCGMVMAADLSQRLGLIDRSTQARISNVIKAAGLPTIAPNLGSQRWIELMKHDKKTEGGRLQFVLVKSLGSAVITDVPNEVLQATLEQSLEAP